MALSQIRKNGQGGRGLAIAGLIMSILGLLLGAAFVACAGMLSSSVPQLSEFLTAVPLTMTAGAP